MRQDEDAADPASTAGTRPAAAPGRSRVELLAFLELCGLAGLAITQPVLDVVGRSPDFLLLERVGARDVVLLAAVFALLPPVLLWALGAAAGLGDRRRRRAAHVATVAGLLLALALQLGKQVVAVRGLPLALGAVTAAALGTLAYLRFGPLRWTLRVAAVGPLLSAGLFLLASPVSALVLPSPETGPAPGTARDAAHPPIVVVSFDELPTASLLDTQGRIDARNFPNFAWLAESSTWYRNATGVTQWTHDSFAAMLTGRYPNRSIAATYRNYPFNLFTLLGGTYDLNVHETATQFCPPDRCRAADGPSAGQGGLGPVLRRSSALLGTLVSPSEAPAREPSADLDHKVAPAGTDAEGRPVSRPAGFREFLDGLRPSATPRLHFLHLVLPHRPWQFLPSGLRYPDPPQTFGMPFASAKWEAEPTWTRLGRQRHWLQTAYTDRLLGEVLGTLKDRGLLDQSTVIVTADHGVSFANGTQARVFGHGNAPWVMWVPLFIKAPGQQTGRVDDRNWEHVDLLPTVADAAGVTVPWETDGRSALRGPPRAAATKRFYAVRADRPPKVSTVDGRANLAIAMRGGGLPPHPEVRPRLGAEPGTGLDRLVPRPDLVGRAVDSLTVTAGGPAVTVDQLATFGQSAAGRDKLPAFVHGTAPAGLAPGTLLAVALNGRIGTVATVAPEGRQQRLRFGGMLPAGLFEADSNRLELFVVEGAERLRRVSLKRA